MRWPLSLGYTWPQTHVEWPPCPVSEPRRPRLCVTAPHLCSGAHVPQLSEQSPFVAMWARGVGTSWKEATARETPHRVLASEGGTRPPEPSVRATTPQHGPTRARARPRGHLAAAPSRGRGEARRGRRRHGYRRAAPPPAPARLGSPRPAANRRGGGGGGAGPPLFGHFGAAAPRGAQPPGGEDRAGSRTGTGSGSGAGTGTRRAEPRRHGPLPAPAAGLWDAVGRCPRCEGRDGMGWAGVGWGGGTRPSPGRGSGSSPGG